MKRKTASADDLVMFAELVKAGGFSKAAQRLSLPKSTISRRVARLETALGARLLVRNTRTMRLTDAGEVLLTHCRNVVHATTLASNAIENLEDPSVGALRVAACSVARWLIVPVVRAFVSQQPQARIRVLLNVRALDLHEQHLDLAIRVGPPSKQDLSERRLGSSRFSLYASPGYFDKLPRPLDASELAKSCVLHPGEVELLQSQITRNCSRANTSPVPHCLVNDYSFIKSLLMGGAGIGLLPDFMCVEEVAHDVLRRVEPPQWTSPLVDVHAMCPSRQDRKPTLTQFLALLEAHVERTLEKTPTSGFN